jgi:hypothetical protein
MTAISLSLELQSGKDYQSYGASRALGVGIGSDLRGIGLRCHIRDVRSLLAGNSLEREKDSLVLVCCALDGETAALGVVRPGKANEALLLLAESDERAESAGHLLPECYLRDRIRGNRNNIEVIDDDSYHCGIDVERCVCTRSD